MELFVYIFGALFSVINPLGAVPIFVGLTQDDSVKERQHISFWTAINVFIILLVAFFIGQYALSFFGISIDALRIAGGFIIVNSGFSLLNRRFNKGRGVHKEVEQDAQRRNDIALSPLAIPMLAGPGSISLLIAMYPDYPAVIEKVIAVGAMASVALVIFLMLRSAHYLSRILGASGIVAISRIIGFITVAIGVQYIISSIVNIVKSILTP
jgi:multiple antibiotic resistance protein